MDGIRFGRKGTAEPSGRGASSRRRFCRRSSSTRRSWPRFQGRRASVSASKIRPGPGSAVEADVRTRIPSAPAPLRHRSPQPTLSRPCTPHCGSPYPTRSAPPTSEECAPRGNVRLRLHGPGKPPTFHPASESPSATHTDINKTVKQQNDTTTQLHNNTITKPHNWESEGHEFWAPRLHDDMSSRLQDVSQY